MSEQGVELQAASTIQDVDDEAEAPGVCGLPHKATAQHHLAPAEHATQTARTIWWFRHDDESRSPRDEANYTWSESARESLDTDEANEALRRDHAWLKKNNHILAKQNAQLMAQIEALEQDAALRANMAASSHTQRDRDVDKLMVELHSANEETACAERHSGRRRGTGCKDTPRASARARTATRRCTCSTCHSHGQEGAGIKALKGLLGLP